MAHVELTNNERRWVLTCRGTSDYAPPRRLIRLRLATQVGKEVFYPPVYQLTSAGRDLQTALRVEPELKRP